MKMVRISKTYTVTVYRFIEVNEDADGNLDDNYIEEELNELELHANLDLANIGQEQPFGTDYYCEDEDIDVGEEDDVLGEEN